MSDAVIVGSGLAGLSCARRLHEQGITCVVLEASESVGGRARTDAVDGFLLDRGFQVFLTAYPEARRLLDYDSLQLRPFDPGALVRYAGRFHRFSDPWRRPAHLPATVLSPVATWADKFRLAVLKHQLGRLSLEEIFQRPETTTRAALERRGFSPRIMEAFFRPFLGGVFLDPTLETSSRMFEFVFHMFGTGAAALPANGMGAIAQQLAKGLPGGTVQYGSPVSHVSRGQVVCSDGATFQADAVVLAVGEAVAASLLERNHQVPKSSDRSRGVSCVYFSADQPPIREPILVLNGDGTGPVNNLCVPSQVTSSYAPVGKSLISATVLGVPDENGDSLERQVRTQLTDWFGRQVDSWSHLRTYRISRALPFQPPGHLSPVEKPTRVEDDIYVCGDYLDTASIQGALASGRRAADAVVNNR